MTTSQLIAITGRLRLSLERLVDLTRFLLYCAPQTPETERKIVTYWRRRLSDLWHDSSWEESATQETRDAFEQLKQDFNTRCMWVGSLLLSITILCWVPVDILWPPPTGPHPTPLSYSWRLIYAGLALCFVFALRGWEPARRRYFLTTCLFVVSTSIFLGWAVAQLEWIQGWPYGGQPFPLILAFLLLTFRQRLFLVLISAILYPSVYFLCSPTPFRPELGSLYAALTFGPVLLGLFLGHHLTILRRRQMLQQRQADQLTQQLQHANQRLADQLDEKTRSLQTVARLAEQARESERKTIAQELHDELGQLITGMRFEVELARMQIAPQQEQLATSLDGLDTLVGQTASAVRDVLTMLRPKIVQQSGLLAATRWLVRSLQRRHLIDCALQLPTQEPELDEQAAISLFRIIQESVTNTLKHANASRLSITLQLEAAHLRLCVADDGVGCPDDVLHTTTGLGLAGIQERVRARQGSFHLDSPKEGGTCLDITFPLKALRHPPGEEPAASKHHHDAQETPP